MPCLAIVLLVTLLVLIDQELFIKQCVLMKISLNDDRSMTTTRPTQSDINTIGQLPANLNNLTKYNSRNVDGGGFGTIDDYNQSNSSFSLPPDGFWSSAAAKNDDFQTHRINLPKISASMNGTMFPIITMSDNNDSSEKDDDNGKCHNCIRKKQNISAKLKDLADSFNKAENRSLVLFLSVIVLVLILLFCHYFYQVNRCTFKEGVKQLSDNLKLAGIVAMNNEDKEQYFYEQLRRQLRQHIPEKNDKKKRNKSQSRKRRRRHRKSKSGTIESFRSAFRYPPFRKKRSTNKYSAEDNSSNNSRSRDSSTTNTNAANTTNQSTIINSILEQFRSNHTESNYNLESSSCDTISSMSLKQLEMA